MNTNICNVTSTQLIKKIYKITEIEDFFQYFEELVGDVYPKYGDNFEENMAKIFIKEIFDKHKQKINDNIILMIELRDFKLNKYFKKELRKQGD